VGLRHHGTLDSRTASPVQGNGRAATVDSGWSSQTKRATGDVCTGRDAGTAAMSCYAARARARDRPEPIERVGGPGTSCGMYPCEWRALMTAGP